MSKITLIVAMNKERVIGTNNQLPWHIPEDLAYFKQITLGKPIIMGRKTFESIGRVLPGRKNIVISNKGYQHEGVVCYSSLQEALDDNTTYEEICIIGGGQIFAEAVKFADTIHITEVECDVTNPCAWFPALDPRVWQFSIIKEFVSSSGIKCIIKEYHKHDFK